MAPELEKSPVESHSLAQHARKIRAELAAMIAALLPFGKRGDPENPSVDFEHSDISARNVVLIGCGVIGLVWLAVTVCYLVFFHYAAAKSAQSANYPGMAAYGGSLPPEPRLQQSPPADYQQMVATDESQLHSYHWVDRAHGLVSIPIEQAIDLTAQRGIPPQPAPPGNLYYLPRAGDRLTGFEERQQGDPR